MDKFDFTPATAVVTGAASGIGEQLAYALTAHIPDVLARVAPARYPALLKTAQRLQSRGH